MLLLIDAGNTRVKWALADTATMSAGSGNPGQLDTSARWAAEGALPLAEITKLGAVWAAHGPTQVLVSNVAGVAVGESLRQQIAIAVAGTSGPQIDWFSSTAECAGIRNGYQEPERLGSDRLAAMIGARVCYGQGALLVVTCGTATTIDALTAGNLFSGGMILPGLDLMAGALAHNTAQLQMAEIEDGPLPVVLFGDDTQSAISHGCLAAQCGAIEHAFAQFAKHQQSPSRCVLSGGAAGRIAQHLSIPYQVAGNLVLAGLFHIAMERKMEHATPC